MTKKPTTLGPSGPNVPFVLSGRCTWAQCSLQRLSRLSQDKVPRVASGDVTPCWRLLVDLFDFICYFLSERYIHGLLNESQFHAEQVGHSVFIESLSSFQWRTRPPLWGEEMTAVVIRWRWLSAGLSKLHLSNLYLQCYTVITVVQKISINYCSN